MNLEEGSHDPQNEKGRIPGICRVSAPIRSRHGIKSPEIPKISGRFSRRSEKYEVISARALGSGEVYGCAYLLRGYSRFRRVSFLVIFFPPQRISIQ